MAITSVGTPTIHTGTASPIAGTWGTGQNRVVGNLLVAVVTFTATTSAAATSETSGTTGWTNVVEVGSATTALARTAIWVMPATGGDAAPSFSSATSGTVTSSCTLYELAGATWNAGTSTWADTTGTIAAAAATISAQTATTSADPSRAGEFAIAGFCRERATVASTVTATSPFNLDGKDAGTTSTGHYGSMSLANPATTADLAATVNYSGTSTTASGAGVIAVFLAGLAGPAETQQSQPAGVRVVYVPAGSAQASRIPIPPVTAAHTLAQAPPALHRAAPARAHTGPAGSAAAGPAVPVTPLAAVPPVPQHRPVRAPVSLRPPAAGSASTGGATPAQQSSGSLSQYGRIFSNGGAYSGTGPPVRPLASPANQVLPVASGWHATFSKGRSRSLPGTRSGVGPAVTPLRRPVRAAIPLIISGGAMSMPGMTTMAVSHAGRVFSSQGSYSGAGPFLTPPKGPVQQPQRAPGPQLHGRVISRRGAYAGLGPVLPPVQGPASGPIGRRGPPSGRGRGSGSRGVLPAAVAVAPLYPLHAPVRAPLPRPPAGYAQTMVSLPFQAAPVPAPLYPLHGPVRAQPAAPVLHGRAVHQPGAYSGTGPAVTPLHQPARARLPLQPVLRGRALSRAGAYSGQGRPAAPLTGPARARLPLQPVLRGRSESLPGAYSGHGPAVAPQHQPVIARRPLPPRGYTATMVSLPSQAAPVLSVAYPLHGPVQARPAAPVLHGRVISRAGRYSGTGPAVTPLHQPARARLPLQPVLRGRALSHAGAYSGTGPAVTPLHQPARARLPLQPVLRGRGESLPGAYSGTGPAVRPLTQPARTRLPVPPFSKGRGTGSRGIPPVPVPAPLYPLQRPVRAPLPGPARYGRSESLRGAYSGQGRPAAPLTGPVRARLPLQPVLRGRGESLRGAYSGEGPAVTPLRQPARARTVAVFSKGRALATPAYVPPVLPVPARILPRATPVRAAGPPPALHGRAATMGALPVPVPAVVPAPLYPLHAPVRAPIPAPVRGGGTGHGSQGIFSGTGVPALPLQQPAGIRVTVLRTGHAQRSAVTAAVAPYVPAPAYPLRGPVRTRLTLPPRGHGGTGAGVYSGAGPAVRPLAGPVRPALPGPGLHGRAAAISPLAVSFPGPPVTPLTRPARAAVLPPFSKGRIIRTPGSAPVPAPLYPLQRPVRAPLPGSVLHGRAASRPGTFSGTGPAVRPLAGPVRARPAFPVLHGRAAAMGALAVSFRGPAVRPLACPVRNRPQTQLAAGGAAAVVLPASPGAFGRAALPASYYGRAFASASTQPVAVVYPAPLYPLQRPVRAPLPQVFSKGHGAGNRGGPVVAVIYPAPLYPLRGPVRAPLPGPALHGRSESRAGTVSRLGPASRPLTQPARSPVPAPFSKGRVIQTPPYVPPFFPVGPRAYPLTQPAGLGRRAPGPVLHGRAIHHAGVYSGEGPAVTPLAGPVAARRPQPARYGRGAGLPGRYSGYGPAPKPLTGPVRARQPLPRRGHGGSTAGTYSGYGPAVRALTAPVRAPRLPVFSKGRTQYTPPYVPPAHPKPTFVFYPGAVTIAAAGITAATAGVSSGTAVVTIAPAGPGAGDVSIAPATTFPDTPVPAAQRKTHIIIAEGLPPG